MRTMRSSAQDRRRRRYKVFPDAHVKLEAPSSILLRASGQLSAWHTSHCVVMLSLSFFTYLTECSRRADVILWAPQGLLWGLTGVSRTRSDGQAGPVSSDGLLALQCGSWTLSSQLLTSLHCRLPSVHVLVTSSVLAVEFSLSGA